MYTQQQLETILTGLFIFSGANNNQGLRPIKGDGYGNKVKRVLKTFNELEEDQGMVTFVSKLRK